MPMDAAAADILRIVYATGRAWTTAGHGDAIERAYAPGSELYAWFTALIGASR
jgi:hypothetical protein